jgi:hypothetical protein
MQNQTGEPGHCVFYYLDLRYAEEHKNRAGHPGEPGHCNFYYMDLRYAGDHKSRAESDW